MKKQFYPFLQAIVAAILFGASAPLSKILLADIDPIPLAAFLYLGSGVGAVIFMGIQHLRHNGKSIEAHVTKAEIPWLIGAILAGGVAAPIILLFGLRQTPASTASLLLNFESVGTTLIAILFFKEAVGKRAGIAIGLITLSSILLSWTGGAWGFSLGALGIIAACFLWGLDNNFTRHISAKNPLVIVAIKGFCAGTFSLLLAFFLERPLPTFESILWAMLVGVFSYGLSIWLFILAMRDLGAARTSALFGTAPFIGSLLSLALFFEMPQWLFWLALPVMGVGAWLMLSEDHEHHHVHEPVEHSHRHFHPDDHHEHEHSQPVPLVNGWHAHEHGHEYFEHAHPHTPDMHHRHEHLPEMATEG